MKQLIPMLLLLAGALVVFATQFAGGPEPIEEPSLTQDSDPGTGTQPVKPADLETGMAEQIEPEGSSGRQDASVALPPVSVTVVTEEEEPVPEAKLNFLDRGKNKAWKDAWRMPTSREVFMRTHGLNLVTDGMGKVQIPGCERGTVFVRAAGMTAWLDWDEPLQGPQKLVLRAARDLRVKVVGARGKPKNGISVVIVREAEGLRQNLLLRETREEGVAVFTMVERVLRTQVHEPARFFVTFASPFNEAPEVELDPNALPDEEIVLNLPPSGTVQIEVVDEAGRRLRTLADIAIGQMAVIEGSDEPIFRPIHSQRLIGGVASFRVGVDATFAVRLTGSRERADLVEELTGPTRQGEQKTVQVAWTERFPVLTGVAIDSTGGVLRSFRGRYMVWSKDVGSSGPPLLTGPDGAFRVVVNSSLKAQAGRYVELELYPKQVTRPMYARLDLSGALKSGETDIGTVAFAAKPLLVSGTVRDMSGVGLTGVHVRVLPKGGQGRQVVKFAATSLQDGKFSIYGELDDATSFEVMAVRRNYKEARLDDLEPGVTDIVLTMMPEPPE